MSSSSNIFGFFVDEELDHQSDGEDDENHFSTEELRREIQRISVASEANRLRNISIGFSSNVPIPGHYIDDADVEFDCDALRSEAIALNYGLPEAIHCALSNVNPAKPAWVLELAAVKAMFPSLNDDQILDLDTIEILSTNVDILAKALAIAHCENSLISICGGDTSKLSKRSSKSIARGVFLLIAVEPTVDEAIIFANSKEAVGGRERAQEMKLQANIDSQARMGGGNLVLAKKGDDIICKFGSINAVIEMIHIKKNKPKSAFSNGGLDISGVNFSIFVGSRNDFVNLQLHFNHYELWATYLDKRLLAAGSPEVQLTRGSTTRIFSSVRNARNSDLRITEYVYVEGIRMRISARVIETSGAVGLLAGDGWIWSHTGRLSLQKSTYYKKGPDNHYHEDVSLSESTAPPAMIDTTAGGTPAGTSSPHVTTIGEDDIVDLVSPEQMTTFKTSGENDLDYVDLVSPPANKKPTKRKAPTKKTTKKNDSSDEECAGSDSDDSWRP